MRELLLVECEHCGEIYDLESPRGQKEIENLSTGMLWLLGCSSCLSKETIYVEEEARHESV